MSIKEKLYSKIFDLLNIIQGYLNTHLASYRLRKNIEYAEAFLKKFRVGKDESRSLQNKPKPNPNCRHLKGRIFRDFFGFRDYNVAGHCFADGKIKIWCLNNCGFYSIAGDANWKDALLMVEQSSNKPSSSERYYHGEKVEVATRVVYQDKI